MRRAFLVCVAVVALLVPASWALHVPSIEVDRVPFAQEQNDLITTGDNKHGQLGLGFRVQIETVTSPTINSLLDAGDRVVHISTGCNAEHAFVVTENGALIGWGRNDAGQLGVQPQTEALAPKRFDKAYSLGFVRHVVVGKSHTLAINRKNELFRFQNGKIETIQHPHMRIVSIAAGDDFSVVTTEDGRVFWLGNVMSEFKPISVHDYIASVEVCASQVYLLTAEGSLWVWGDNSKGQLCAPDTVKSVETSNPVSVSVDTKYGNIVSIRGGEAATLVLTDDGVLLSCSPAGQFAVVEGLGEHKVVSYSVGLGHALATLATGDVYGWGSNAAGELGIYDGTTSFKTPTRMHFQGYGDRKYAAAAAGSKFSILLAECANRTCVHGVASPADGCACVCDLSWSGEDCAVCIHDQPGYCNQNGVLDRHACKCDCKAPWTGQQCDTCDIECEHGGQATVAGSVCGCRCFGPWRGSHCDVCPIKPSECYQGTLDAETCTCTCKAPWGGSRCDTCTLEASSCVHGTLDRSRCECRCDGDWTGETCNECGLQSNDARSCFDVKMWNSVGDGWSGHKLFITPVTDSSVHAFVGTLPTGGSKRQTVCLEPGLYTAYSCGSGAASYGIGWSVINVVGQSSDVCGETNTTVLVKGGGCNMGDVDKDTCSCKCRGNWHGKHACVPMALTMTEEVSGSWENSFVYFEDEHGQVAKAIPGRVGTNDLCIEDGTYKTYVCAQEVNKKISAELPVTWKVTVNYQELTGTGFANDYCDLARLHATVMNFTEALNVPAVSKDLDTIFEKNGITLVRPPERPEEQSRSGYCDKCDVLGKCKHGTLHPDCSCKCDHGWGGDLCNECQITLSGYREGHARLDKQHCKVNCVGAWFGDKCDHCSLQDDHCAGIVNHALCVCQAVEDKLAPSVGNSPAQTSSDNVNQCKHPWTGPDCATCPRAKDFCLHGGDLSNCECDCHVPWMGEDCSVCAINERSCIHGQKAKDSCACACDGGWAGMLCGECNVKCTAHGKLNDTCQCACEEGWGGDLCGICARTSDDCLHGSLDSDTCTCTCDEDWGGYRCDDCQIKGCGNGLVDTASCSCKCNKNWDGKFCQECVLANSECVHGAVNSTCQCSCENSWTGEFCDVCSMGEHSCVHGVFEEELCQCKCPEHRSGKFCEVCELTPAQCGGSVNADRCTCVRKPAESASPSTSFSQSATASPPPRSKSPSITPSPSPSTEFDPAPYKGIVELGALNIDAFQFGAGADAPNAHINVRPYSALLGGNAWKLFQLAKEITISERTHFEFDVKVDVLCDFVAVGLMTVPEPGKVSGRLISLVGNAPANDESYVSISQQVALKHAQWQHYNILVGNVYKTGSSITHLALVSACSQTGSSSVEFRRVQVYEGESERARTDLLCGPSHLGPHGGPAECSSTTAFNASMGVAPCCSSTGQCGMDSASCDCDHCVDFRPGMAPPQPFAFATTGQFGLDSPTTTAPATPTSRNSNSKHKHANSLLFQHD